jgi:hypothetical protein
MDRPVQTISPVAASRNPIPAGDVARRPMSPVLPTPLMKSLAERIDKSSWNMLDSILTTGPAGLIPASSLRSP